jgi:hypothetical protein
MQAEASTFTTTKQRYLAQHFKLQEAQHNACAGLDLPSQSHIKGLAWSAIELVAAQGNLALKQAHSSASLVSLQAVGQGHGGARMPAQAQTTLQDRPCGSGINAALRSTARPACAWPQEGFSAGYRSVQHGSTASTCHAVQF